MASPRYLIHTRDCRACDAFARDLTEEIVEADYGDTPPHGIFFYGRFGDDLVHITDLEVLDLFRNDRSHEGPDPK